MARRIGVSYRHQPAIQVNLDMERKREVEYCSEFAIPWNVKGRCLHLSLISSIHSDRFGFEESLFSFDFLTVQFNSSPLGNQYQPTIYRLVSTTSGLDGLNSSKLFLGRLRTYKLRWKAPVPYLGHQVFDSFRRSKTLTHPLTKRLSR